MLLDRFGPRRVQSGLLLIAAVGATVFGMSSGFLLLLVARAMIGLGAAGALMAGLKIIVLWFPRERVALVNGYMIMLGALGAVTATAPAEALLDWIGWRDLFQLLAAASAIVAALIYVVVPERTAVARRIGGIGALKLVYSDPRFWRIAPLSATCIGSAWALQSLWAAPWLSDVAGLDRGALVTRLSIMAIALCLGALFLGGLADWVRGRGKNMETLFAIVGAVFIAAELALVLLPSWPSLLPWCVVSIVGSAVALSCAIIGDYFPAELVARANAGLNVLHFAGAFVVQYGTGLILQYWLPQGGHYPLIAYQVAFGVNIVLQIAALIWFVVPWLGPLNWKRATSMAPEWADGRSSLQLKSTPAELLVFEPDEAVEW